MHQTPKHFTLFLTPPVGNDEEDEEHVNLLKLAVQEQFDEKDLVLLTKIDVAIPMKATVSITISIITLAVQKYF